MKLVDVIEDEIPNLPEKEKLFARHVIDAAWEKDTDREKTEEILTSVAQRLTQAWGWNVTPECVSAYRYQNCPLRLRAEEPLNFEMIDSWAQSQKEVYGRGIRPLHGVYFIQADFKGLIKIGFSSDFLHRAKAYSVHCPCPFSLVGFIFGEQKLEKQIHATFARYRVRGEWFHPSSDLVSFVREVQDRVDLNDPQYYRYKVLLRKIEQESDQWQSNT